MFRIVDLLPYGFWEKEYLAAACSILTTTPIDADVTVIVTNDRNALPEHHGATVVILVSDETHGVPDYHRDVLMVFKQYGPLTAVRNVRPIPLGCMSGFRPALHVPILERPYDVGFCGYLHPTRAPFAALAAQLERDPRLRCSFVFTEFSGGGVPVGEYARRLGDTKIALAPIGGSSTESFRVFEALRTGCIVMTPRKPPFWFYEGWPALEIDDWNEDAHAQILELLADRARLTALHEAHLAWWQNRCSEKPLAAYIARETAAALVAEAEYGRS